MDRNSLGAKAAETQWVALRKESVDRNDTSQRVKQPWGASLSARRAWIEIQNDGPSFSVHEVALRKESVDRNVNKLKTPCVRLVALRKESVDRNYR